MAKEWKELEYHGATVGKKQSSLYQVWSQIKQRCFNPNCPKYPNYGGRGIKMDPVWRESFATFQEYILKKIGERPSKKHTLDRTDNDKGYFPGNVRWSLPEGQARNKQTNHIVFFQGKDRTLQEVSEMTGIDKRRLQYRVAVMGMTIDAAVSLPLEHGVEFYTYKGETHKLGTWAEKLKIPYHVLYDRLYRMEWTVEEAFETPYQPRGA